MALSEMYSGGNKTPFSNALSNFMQARQMAGTNRLMAPAMSGDLSALNQLMSVNPEAGMKVQQAMAQQQQARQQQEQQAAQQSFENEMATKKFGLSEQELELARQKATGPQASQLKSFQPQLMQNPETGSIEMMVPIVDEATGQARWSPIAGAGGLQVARETPEQAREREAATKVDTAGKSATATKTAERDQAWIDKGVDAYDGLNDINRMIELNDVISSGGYAKAATRVADALGYTPADEGEFRTLQRTMVLGQLKKAFTGAISDAEREFLESALADLGQGKEVNKRTLERLKGINEREVRRAKSAASRQGISWEEYVGETQKPAPSGRSGGSAKFLGFE
jgi:hypothetical protein